MTEEIVNKVAQSELMTFDLEEYYPEGERILIDINEWLYEGLVLREKEFRKHVSNHNWQQYQSAYVALYCSTDAIVPGWAYMLLTSKLQPYAKTIVMGNLEQLETTLYQSIIEKIDVSQYIGKPVIVKGCSNKAVPPNAYLWITSKLQGVAKSIFYGEACSSVPIYKKKKS